MSDEQDKPQADKFRDMARELECDEDEAAFEEKVRKVATATESVRERQAPAKRGGERESGGS